MYYPKHLKNEVTLLTMEQRIEWLEEDRKKLRKEYDKLKENNKKLKEKWDMNLEDLLALQDKYDELEHENKKLKEELKRYKDLRDSWEDL